MGNARGDQANKYRVQDAHRQCAGTNVCKHLAAVQSDDVDRAIFEQQQNRPCCALRARWEAAKDGLALWQLKVLPIAAQGDCVRRNPLGTARHNRRACRLARSAARVLAPCKLPCKAHLSRAQLARLCARLSVTRRTPAHGTTHPQVFTSSQCVQNAGMYGAHPMRHLRRAIDRQTSRPSSCLATHDQSLSRSLLLAERCGRRTHCTV